MAMSVEIVQVEVGLVQNFNYLIGDVASRQAAVVDPAFEVDRLLRLAAERQWTISTVLLTHTHNDHIDGVGELVAATGASVHVGRDERERVEKGQGAARFVELDGGETIGLGEARIDVLATPGHTLAGRSYLVEGALFTGDTLFIGGVGRTDFAGGDPRVLFASLQTLAALPEETRVYPGHDYGQTLTSTIGWERTSNPYLLCRTVDEFVALRTGKSAPRPVRGPR